MATVAPAIVMAGGAVTVTLAVALVTPVALAVIVADPEPTAVIGTVIVVVFGAKVTEAGAVATVVLVLARPTVKLLVGAVDNVSVTFCVADGDSVMLDGAKLSAAPVPPAATCTCVVCDVNPNEVTVIVAGPAVTPVNIGRRAGAGAEAPCAMKMLSGATVTFEVSLLATLKNTPPAPAGVPKLSGNATTCPGAMVIEGGMTIPVGADTVTVAVAVPKFGVTAVMEAVPAATPLTGIVTLVVPAVNVTVAGTVATAGLLEVIVAVRPAVAAAESVSVRFVADPAFTVVEAGASELVPPGADTVTVDAAVPKFGVTAVMEADPAATPVTEMVAVVAPVANVTVAGTDATAGLLDVTVAVSPAGAAAESVSVRFVADPAFTVAEPGASELVPPGADTVTVDAAVPKFGVTAVMEADPAATPVTEMVAVVAPVANVTVAGTVAIAGLLDVTVAVSPADAAAESVSVRVVADPLLTVTAPGESELEPPTVITCT
jgi:hypothetical protein